jgi:YHS domain-containing protein
MKRVIPFATLLFLALGCTTTKQTTTAANPPVAAQASAKAINTHCAVDRDDEIDPKVTYLYQGKVVGFCCDKCVAEFKKDPDKYMKDLK